MARRHDQLFGQIASFQALNAAAQRAVAGKRRKPGAAALIGNQRVAHGDGDLRVT